MKIQTIREIQQNVKDFLPIVKGISTVFDNPKDLKMIQLVLSNIALNSEDCVNYSIDRDINLINNTLELCKLMPQERNPALSYILESFITIVEGNLMSEV